DRCAGYRTQSRQSSQKAQIGIFLTKPKTHGDTTITMSSDLRHRKTSLSGDAEVSRDTRTAPQRSRSARCSATTPNVRLRQATRDQPAALIFRASPAWSGQAAIDSDR